MADFLFGKLENVYQKIRIEIQRIQIQRWLSERQTKAYTRFYYHQPACENK